MRIVISGLTAAGKTTLARKIADQFTLDYVSASAILRHILGDTSEYWTPELDQRRTELAVERKVDQLVREAFGDNTSAVFDCWGLPWLAEKATEPATFIWIESNPESRFRKCFVSYLERGDPKTYDECRDIVLAKDAKSHGIFMSNWGFDIYTDRSPFNIVLDASPLIPSASLKAARRGATALYQACLHGLGKIKGARLSIPGATLSADKARVADSLIVSIRDYH